MTLATDLTIIAERDDDRVTLRLCGELDISNRNRLRSAIATALDSRPELLAVDLARLKFMDCSGLRVLVLAHNDAAAQHCQLHLAGARPVVARLMRLTGVGHYLAPRSPALRQARSASVGYGG
jgi:anti-anti-sigma factor